MRRRFMVLQILLACILVTTWTPAAGGPQDESAFHLMSIMEVFPGTVLEPNAQYVMLRAYAAGQSFVAGHKVFFFNAAGAKIDSANVPSNVANGANQMTILFATPQAQALFAIAPDFPMPAAMNPAGGKVCFDASNIDCFAWGNYTGSMTGIGTPYRKDFGLAMGESAVRRMDVAGGATVLDGTDDTNNNENDFNPGSPAGRNNAGGNVVLPPSTCGNNTLEGLEQCDDGNTDPNDGCNSACDDEFCGDGVVQPGETCDDGNLVAGDGCDLLCQSEPECGNGIVEAGEACDDSNLVAGDGCDPLCQLEPVCGNGIVEAGETCDDSNLVAGDGCDPTCQTEPVCGNGITEPGEDCDDSNTTSGDGCDSLCQSEASCPVVLTGDLNQSGTLTSADIIALVNYVFKGGAPPEPCPASGDVNCSGTITSSDIISLVNHVFKAGPPPCDVCTIVPSMWSCP